MPKAKKRKKINEDRILQICNDIAEDIDNKPTKEELKACIVYWQDHYCQVVSQHATKRAQIMSKLLDVTLTISEP